MPPAKRSAQEIRAEIERLTQEAEAVEAQERDLRQYQDEARNRHQENLDKYQCLAGEYPDPEVMKTVRRGYNTFFTQDFRAMYLHHGEAQALADKADDAMSDLFRLVYGKDL